MSLDRTIQRLRAAAEPTRLRLLALISTGEISVGDLSDVLGQSQPRVSRHLKLLVDAGLVSRFRDRHWVYYRLPEDARARELVEQLLRQAPVDDPVLAEDRAGMDQARRSRERSAYDGLGSPGSHWGAGQHGRPDEASLEAALDDALGHSRVGDLLDIGSGAGTLLKLLGRNATTAVGVDSAKEMRLLARSRLQQAGLAGCTVRDADMHALPFPDASFDTVVLDEVLSGSGDRGAVAGEAARVLRPGGTLLILDRIAPVARRLPVAGEPLAENQLQTILGEQGLRIVGRLWFPGRAPDHALFTAESGGEAQRTGTGD